MTTSSGTGASEWAVALVNPGEWGDLPKRDRYLIALMLDAARAEGREEGRAEASAVLDRLGEDYLAKHGGGGDYCRALADVRAHLPAPGGGDRSGG